MTVYDWGNGPAVLYQNMSLPVSDGDVFLLSAQGTTISAYQNGSLLASATSSFTASAGSIFIRTAPGSFGATSEVGMVNFNLGAFIPFPAAPTPFTTVDNQVPVAVQLFGRISSGPNAGMIAAVNATDEAGNIAVSGGTTATLSSVDVLEDIRQAVPVMLCGYSPALGEVIACSVDSNGNLITTIGGATGNNPATVDVPDLWSTPPTPVTIFVRTPSEKLVAAPISSTYNALGNSINTLPATAASSGVDLIAQTAQPQQPTPVILVGRIQSGVNKDAIVAVSLTSAGALCLSGSGTSGSTNVVDVFDQGEAKFVVAYGRNPSTGKLQSIGLNSGGALQLN